MFKLKISTKQSGTAKHEKKSSSSNYSRTRQQQHKPWAGIKRERERGGDEGGAPSSRYILKQIYVAQRQAVKAKETEVSSTVGKGKTKSPKSAEPA